MLLAYLQPRLKLAAISTEDIQETDKIPNTVRYSLRPNMLMHLNSTFIRDIICTGISAVDEEWSIRKHVVALRNIARSIDPTLRSRDIHLEPPHGPLTDEALDDLCYNTADLYVQARQRITHIQLMGSGYAPFMKRLYDNPSLFPSVESIDIEMRPPYDAYEHTHYLAEQPLYLRAKRIKLAVYARLDEIVQNAICDELDISGSSTCHRQLANQHVRKVTVAKGVFGDEFPNMRTLCMVQKGSSKTCPTFQVAGCPLLEAVAFAPLQRPDFVAALEIPTLRWLPMDTMDLDMYPKWHPLTPWHIERYFGTYESRSEDKRHIVEAMAPHLLPQLEPLISWTPHFRYNSNFNWLAMCFFVAIDRLVDSDRVAYSDPAALEYVLRNVLDVDLAIL